MRNLAKSFIEQQTGLSGGRLMRLWRIVCIAGLMSGMNVVGYTIGCSLFVDRIGASGLPLSYVFVGLVASPLYVWFANILNRSAKPRLVRWILMVSALVLTALWACLRLDSPAIYYAIYVFTYFQWTLQLDIVLPNLISDYYTSRDYNRYAPWIVMAQTLGGTLGGGFVGLAAGTIGAPALLLAVVPLALLVWWRVRVLELGEAPIDAAQKEAEARQRRRSGEADNDGYVGRLTIFRRYPIVRLLAASTFLWVILYSLAEYQYFEIYSLRFQGSLADLTAFLGGFSAINSVTQFAMLYVVTRAAIDKLGVRRMAVFYPLTTLLGFVGLAFSPSFGFAIAMNVNSATIETSFNQPIHTLFYNPIPTRIAGTVRALCDGFSYSSGLLVVGVALLLTEALDFPLTGVAAIGVLLSLAYVLTRYRLSEEYFKTLVANLGDEELDPDDVRAGFASIPRSRVRELLAQLESGDAAEKKQILQFLPYIKKPSQATETLKALIPEADRGLRQEIVNCWRDCGDRDPQVSRDLRAHLYDSVPSLRAVSLHACVVRREVLAREEAIAAIEQNEAERDALSAYESIELETLAYLAAELLSPEQKGPELADRCDRFWQDLAGHTLDAASTATATRLDIAIQAIRDTGSEALRERLDEVLRTTQDADTIRKIFSALAELAIDRSDADKQELAGMASPYLGHPDARVRIGTLELLGTLAVEDFWDDIAQCLTDMEFNVRPKAAAALQGYGEHRLEDLEQLYLRSPLPGASEAAVAAIAAIDTPKARDILNRYLEPSFAEIATLLDLMGQVPRQREEWQPVCLALANYGYEIADRILLVVYHLGDSATQYTVKKVRSRLLDERARERANAIEALASMNTYKDYITPVLKILEFVPSARDAPRSEEEDRALLDRLAERDECWVSAAVILVGGDFGHNYTKRFEATCDPILRPIVKSLKNNSRRIERVRHLFFLKTTTLFRGIRLFDLWQIVAATAPEKLAASEVLLDAGNAGVGLYILYKGKLQAKPEPLDDDDDDRTVPVLGLEEEAPAEAIGAIAPGDFFGGTVLMGGLEVPCPVTIVAEEDSELLVLSHTNFRMANETMPSLAFFVTQPCLNVEFDW
ncbi:MAG: hypothetical protein ACFB9N_04845 [Geitlerinemataceae cyanobacterium]